MIKVLCFEDLLQIGFAGQKLCALLFKTRALFAVHKAGVMADRTGVDRIQIICRIACLYQKLLFFLLVLPDELMQRFLIIMKRAPHHPALCSGE